MAQVLETLNDDLKNALKSGDSTTVSALRFLLSKINNARIEKGSDLTDEEIVSVISRDAKGHRESIEAYEKGGRDELAQKEKAELAVLEKYLPEQLTDEEIEKIVVSSIEKVGAKSVSDMGKAMSVAMAEVAGRADGVRVSSIVKSKLVDG